MSPALALVLAASAVWTASPVAAQTASDEETLKVGKRVFLLCQACHTVEQNGLNKIGPNLWGMFGHKPGSKPDYKYSDALKKIDAPWTDATVDAWLTSPKDYAPGTKMAFRGIDNPDNRKAVIAYLKQQTGAKP